MGALFSKPPCPLPLSVENLLRECAHLEAQGRMTNELRNLFDKALRVFPQERVEVQENAKVVLQNNSIFLEFISGKGESVFTFFTINGQPHYNLRQPAPVRDQLLPDPEPLSATSLLRRRSQLESQGQMTEELRSCMDLALKEYLQEPKLVQENAQMLIQARDNLLAFRSGRGECQICVYYFADRGAQYDVKAPLYTVVTRMLHRKRYILFNLILPVVRPPIQNFMQLIWDRNWHR